MSIYKYTTFSEEDHQRLINLIRVASQPGERFMVTNITPHGSRVEIYENCFDESGGYDPIEDMKVDEAFAGSDPDTGILSDKDFAAVTNFLKS
jgi:hypothetical protein